MNDKLQKAIDRLNPEQKKATLNTVGPELIIAGAGSGKTRVLTTRIALLMEQGIPPERILALTFTKKAADEMKKRIVEMEGDEAKIIRMGTFHSVFISFLRPFAQYLNFPNNFTILDEDDALSCLKRCIQLVLNENRPPIEQWTDKMKKQYETENNFYKHKNIMSIISAAKNNLVTPEEYVKDETSISRDRKNGRPLTAKIFKTYRDTCFTMKMMDFDDILLYTDLLMHNYPDIQKEIAAYFDYILVDEYQDTNMAQYSILSRLTYKNKNICVVGDDSQSIYAFRGARIENILNFHNDFKNAKIFRLEENYRSTRKIVEAANRLIEHNYNRIPKTCFSSADEGQEIDINELKTDKDEARFIAETIENTRRFEKTPYKDFAVLYRTNSQSRAIEDALVRKNIPYIIYSGTSFFDRMEVKDQMAYFKLAVNPDDNESFRRVANKPIRGIGDSAISRLAGYAHAQRISLWQAVNRPELAYLGIGNKALEGLCQFRDIIRTCNELNATKSAYETAYEISNITGFYNEYKADNDPESQKRADNVRELIDSVKAFEEDVDAQNKELKNEKRSKDLTGYLQSTLLLSNADTDTKDNDDKVSLMTVHCSKGLEFECVFIAGMEEGLFPLQIERTTDELEEERRLFYVAVTRAKKILHITKADKRIRFGKSENHKISFFVNELLKEEKKEPKKEDKKKDIEP
jgi:DNA helicase-2/ATP-dependent DNA helicase PcrA